MLDARYMSDVPERTQSKELFVLCPFWDLAGSCGLQTRLDGRPYEYHDHNKFGGAKECEVVARNTRAYGIL